MSKRIKSNGGVLLLDKSTRCFSGIKGSIQTREFLFLLPLPAETWRAIKQRFINFCYA